MSAALPLLAALVPASAPQAPSAPQVAALAPGVGTGAPARAPIADDRDFDVALELAAAQLAALSAPPAPPIILLEVAVPASPETPTPESSDTGTAPTATATTTTTGAAWPVPASPPAAPRATAEPAPGEIVLPALADLRATFAALAARSPLGARVTASAARTRGEAPATPVTALEAEPAASGAGRAGPGSSRTPAVSAPVAPAPVASAPVVVPPPVSAPGVSAPVAPAFAAPAPVVPASVVPAVLATPAQPALEGVRLLQSRSAPGPAPKFVQASAPSTSTIAAAPALRSAVPSVTTPVPAQSSAPVRDVPDGAPSLLVTALALPLATHDESESDQPPPSIANADPVVAARAAIVERASRPRSSDPTAALEEPVDEGSAPTSEPEPEVAPRSTRSPMPVLGRLLEHVRAVIARTLGAEHTGEPVAAPRAAIAEALPRTSREGMPPPAAAPVSTSAAAPTAATMASTPLPAAPAPADARPAPADGRASAREEGERPATAGTPGTTVPVAASSDTPAPAIVPSGVPTPPTESDAGPRTVRAPDVPTDVPTPAQAAVDRAASAVRGGDRVTLRFDGEDGVSGRIRLSMRGDTLHATIVSTGARLEPGSGVSELERLLGERGFAGARVSVQEPGATSPGSQPSFPSDGQAPRDDARREAFARAHDERAQSDSQGRPGRQRPRHPEEEKA